MGVKTSSKTSARKSSAKKASSKKAALTQLKQSAPETKYQCKKCKRKITVLVGVSSVWCNRCSAVMQPI